MSTHGDGGKGSGRRKEDASKIRDNWDLIFGAKKDKPMNEHDDEHETRLTTMTLSGVVIAVAALCIDSPIGTTLSVMTVVQGRS